MSFKIMNGVEVYDKSEVDAIKENIQETTGQHTSDITQLKTKTNSLENSKANTSQVQDLANSLAADERRLTGAESNISEHSQRITALENDSVTTTQFNQAMNEKADKSYAQQTRQTANNNHNAITELESRVSNVEDNKVNTSDLPQAVNSVVDSIINDKLALIESDINHVVDNAVDDALEDYDTPAQTAQKTATAINTALQSYDDSNTVDQKIATAINNIPAGPTAMTTSEATALVNQYF